MVKILILIPETCPNLLTYFDSESIMEEKEVENSRYVLVQTTKEEIYIIILQLIDKLLTSKDAAERYHVSLELQVLIDELVLT